MESHEGFSACVSLAVYPLLQVVAILAAGHKLPFTVEAVKLDLPELQVGALCRRQLLKAERALGGRAARLGFIWALCTATEILRV